VSRRSGSNRRSALRHGIIQFAVVRVDRAERLVRRRKVIVVRVANKPGQLEDVRNDSGVVLVPNRSYVICVMTTYLRHKRADEAAISNISETAIRCLIASVEPRNMAV